jgi:hypothetical protein
MLVARHPGLPVGVLFVERADHLDFLLADFLADFLAAFFGALVLAVLCFAPRFLPKIFSQFSAYLLFEPVRNTVMAGSVLLW